MRIRGFRLRSLGRVARISITIRCSGNRRFMRLVRRLRGFLVRCVDVVGFIVEREQEGKQETESTDLRCGTHNYIYIVQKTDFDCILFSFL